MRALSDDDRDLIGRCLRAAADGPYFPDWEFPTLFGLDRDTVHGAADRWPTGDVDAESAEAVDQSILHLWGYPHGREGQLVKQLGLDDRRELEALLDRWRAHRRVG